MADDARIQNYEHHAHAPRLTRAGFLFLVAAVAGFALRWFHIGGRYTMAVGLAGLIASVFVLLLISRVYITALQDRIIRLEMRIRTATLLTPAQLELYATLTKAQIVALRFASDAELPALVERAARERMTPDAVKRAVKTWTPDWDRT